MNRNWVPVLYALIAVGLVIVCGAVLYVSGFWDETSSWYK